MIVYEAEVLVEVVSGKRSEGVAAACRRPERDVVTGNVDAVCGCLSADSSSSLQRQELRR